MNDSNWWANKLAQTTPQQPAQGRPTNNIPMPSSQQPMAPMPSFQPVAQPTEKAASARQTALCPDCGSNNFMAVSNAAPRCFDCGYPVEQQGSRFGSLAGAQVQGTTKQALGNNTTNNYNPQGIIGTING